MVSYNHMPILNGYGDVKSERFWGSWTWPFGSCNVIGHV